MTEFIIQILALAIPAWYTLGTAPSHWSVWDGARPYVFIALAPFVLALVAFGCWLISIGSSGYWLLVALWWVVNVPLALTNHCKQ